MCEQLQHVQNNGNQRMPWALRSRVTWIGRWLVIGALCAAVAHGCHPGDHGDADLWVRFIVGVGSR